ncbi:flavin reductase family protein [Clostridium sp. Marseille-QA1073]
MKANFTNHLEEAMENLHTRGAFLTVKSKDKINTMTISWGDIGYQWKRPIFTVLVRKSRYTYEFIENSDNFTVSVPLDDSKKSELAFCGSKSGRDYNKFKECDLAIEKSNIVETPVIGGKNIMHYECKIVYKQELDINLLDEEIKNTIYSDNDIHVLYYGEIVDCYKK